MKKFYLPKVDSIKRTTEKKLTVLLAVLFFASSAHAQDGDFLVSSEYLGQTSKALISFVSPLPANFAVDYYKITYHTIDVHGDPTIASGAVAIPVGESCNSFPVAAYCHGTVLRNYDVPSAQNEESTLVLALASTGFITVAPDYLGLGDNPGRHPYVHAESEATATVDAIRATYELIPTLDLYTTEELFVTGYSQGGQAAMETVKHIQENDLTDELHLIAGAPMSGPYNLSGSQAGVILSDQPYTNPGYIIYLLYSYQLAYGNLFTELSDVVQEPYASIVPPYFDGEQNQYDMGSVNVLLPTMIDELLVDSVLTNLADNPDHPLWLDLEDNDNYNWTPQMPLRMYYCGMDEQVAPDNSVSADSAMNANGAPDAHAINVLESGDHGTCIIPAVVAMYAFFDGLSDGCSYVTSTQHVEKLPNVRLYPNPASYQLTVSLGRDAGNFSLYTTDGRLVKQMNLNGGETTIDLSGISAGAYIAVISADHKWHREMVIVSK